MHYLCQHVGRQLLQQSAHARLPHFSHLTLLTSLALDVFAQEFKFFATEASVIHSDTEQEGGGVFFFTCCALKNITFVEAFFQKNMSHKIIHRPDHERFSLDLFPIANVNCFYWDSFLPEK